MSGECENCGEHCLDCRCREKTQMQFALSALNLALASFSMMGYELSKKIEFSKFKTDKNIKIKEFYDTKN